MCNDDVVGVEVAGDNGVVCFVLIFSLFLEGVGGDAVFTAVAAGVGVTYEFYDALTHGLGL